jgi:hypothetical protein
MKKRGRPPKPADELKAAPISFRITEDLRNRLEDARHTESPPRTLSQEIEARLLRSFGETQRTEDAFGGRTTHALLLALAVQIRAIEVATGKRWWQDRYTYDECLALTTKLFSFYQPKGRRTPPRDPRGSADFGGPGHRTAASRTIPGETYALIAQASLIHAFNGDVPTRPGFKAMANALVPKDTSHRDGGAKLGRKKS